MLLNLHINDLINSEKLIDQNIDKIVQEGLVFTECYVSDALLFILSFYHQV